MTPKYSIVLFLILATIFISFIGYQYFSYRVEYFEYQTNGRIEEIHYDDKGFPTVKIKEKNYTFMYFWNRSIILQAGDSIHKSRGYSELKVYNSDGTIKADLQ